MDNLDWIRTGVEGQFFERKSCYLRTDGGRQRRPIRDVARDVAETMAAMANADGGILVLVPDHKSSDMLSHCVPG